MPSPTELTQTARNEIRRLLYDLKFKEAVEQAETIRQACWKDLAYFDIAYRQAECGLFDDVGLTRTKIGSSYHQMHQPPLSMSLNARLAETLAAAGRFDEAKASLEKTAYRRLTSAIVAEHLVSADSPAEAIAVLDKSDATDWTYMVYQKAVAKLIKLGDEKIALEFTKTIGPDGWRKRGSASRTDSRNLSSNAVAARSVPLFMRQFVVEPAIDSVCLGSKATVQARKSFFHFNRGGFRAIRIFASESRRIK